MAGKPIVDTSSGTLFLDAASVDVGDLDMSPLEEIARPFVCIGNASPDQIANLNRDAWCIIVNKVNLDDAFFRSRPNLRLVCLTATGTDNVDLDAAQAHGVAVANCRGYSTDAVAQHTLMVMLALLRSFPQSHKAVLDGAWSRSPYFCLLDHPIRETRGLRLGIVGWGDIGRRVAELATAFDMEIIVAERPGRSPREGRKAFDEVLQTSDILSLHCPLTPDTEQLIDDRALRLMRNEALLINTARGGLVNETALLEALHSKRIAGAAVDVLSQEPPPPDHPLLRAALPNLIITPHNAWGSREARQRAIEQTAENMAGWLDGRRVRRLV